MSHEQQPRNTQRVNQPLSLRDYWNNPPHSLPQEAHPQNRRSVSKPATPSLWDIPPGLSTDTSKTQATGVVHDIAAPTYADRPPTIYITTEKEGPNTSSQLREQLQRRGVKTLSTSELLTIVLRTGQGNESIVPRIKTLLDTYNLQDLLGRDFGELCNQYGLGEVKAAQLQAVVEVARRLTMPTETEKQQIRCTQDGVRIVRPDMEFLDHEEMRVLLLNTKNYVTANLLMYQGTLNSSVVRTAEVFRPAITRQASGIMVFHNHPTGDSEPSPDDIAVTQELVEAGKILNIELVDHIIIGKNDRFTSLKERIRW